MNNKATLLALRHVIAFTVTVAQRGSRFRNDYMEDLFRVILGIELQVSNWRDLTNIAGTAEMALVPSSSGGYGSWHEQQARKRVLQAQAGDELRKNGLTQGVNQDGGTSWTITNLNKVTITFTEGHLDEDPALTITFRFEIPEQGTKIWKAANTWSANNERETMARVVEWEQVLHFQTVREDLPILTRDGVTLLDDRLKRGAPKFRSSPAPWLLAPLEGESLVIYENSSAAYRLEIGGYSPRTVHHPDHSVFASVGKFSLRLRWDDNSVPRRQAKPDMIEVFVDQALPIKMPERSTEDDEDARRYADDFDDSPRREPEY